MGGLGSTRWNWHQARDTTDPYLSLDVRLLARNGALQPGTIATTSWSCGGEPSGWITHTATRDALLLDYKIKRPRDTDWQQVTARIELTRTACRYGGDRAWFICPGCGVRRAILHSGDGHFRCRECHNLVYSSTREDELSALNRRGTQLLRRLGAEPAWVLNWHIPPPKPPRMHWQTYDRLHAEWRMIRDAAHRTADVNLQALMARTDKLLGK